jgi:hypothetical protein
MKVSLAAAVLAGVMLAVIACTEGALGGSESAAQVPVAIGIDADPTGNTATSLAAIDSCLSVSIGETFQVDLFATDVVDLLAWETYFTYDMSIVNIVSTDVMMFQAANSGSNVFDVSEGLPDIDGWYGVAAVDLAEPPALDSGSGVLARLTLKAVGAGVSPASLSPIDVNGDGTMDLGPSLKDLEGKPISDLDGDGFFDGPITNAQIAVDTACPGGGPVATPTIAGGSRSPVASVSPVIETPAISPTPETPAISPTPETPAAATGTPPSTPQPGSPTATGTGPTEGEGSAWASGPAIIGYMAGGLAVLLLGGFGLLSIRRGRAK